MGSLGFRVLGFQGFRVLGPGFRVLGFMVLGFVWALGFLIGASGFFRRGVRTLYMGFRAKRSPKP